MYKQIQTQYANERILGFAKPRLTASPLFLVLLQGNQMTLVFMEREYSSPEEPHLGIVHMVEVNSPSQTFLCTAQPAKTRSNVMLPLLRLLTGKLPARSDR